MALNGAELLDYACSKFQNGNYSEALEAFVLSYNKGIEADWVIEYIYNCYMSGNKEAFRNAYESSLVVNRIPYDECVLDFIPYRDGEYFIFDKELKIFRGTCSCYEIEQTKIDRNFKESEFSAAAIVMDWDWRIEKNVLFAAKERNVYAICRDIRRASSFCKIPELEDYWKNVILFSNFQDLQEYFHTNTYEYLPRILYGNKEDATKLKEIIDKEHLYRLTPEGRNVSNILLTIGIPTYNRGNLVLKRLANLREMFYDAEIEIIVSKNGTGQYEKEYKMVEGISDARIYYKDWHQELKAVENWHHVVELAHGKYVLFVSDEDDICLNALEHYLRCLKDHPAVSVARAKTNVQYSWLKSLYAIKGIEAFQFAFSRQNYLSGLIVRRETFLHENLSQIQQKFGTNEFLKYYLHVAWCAILSQKGDYMADATTLIIEGESANEIGVNLSRKELALPEYSTYEARINQFYGMIEFLRWLMNKNSLVIVKGLEIAISKTINLLMVPRKFGYDREHFADWIDQFCWASMASIDSFYLNTEKTTYLLTVLKNLCDEALEYHMELMEMDL